MLLNTLPDETRVLPGHMGTTTLGRERATNPFLHELAVEREDPGTPRHVRRAGRGGARPQAARATSRARSSSAPATSGSRRRSSSRPRCSRAASGSRPTSSRRRCTRSTTAAGLDHAAARGHRAGLPRVPRARDAQAPAAREALVPRRVLPPRAPAAGRYRQFWQVGAEAIGSDDPAVDAESILLLAEILEALGTARVRLRLSSLGTPDTRAAYRDELQALPARARGPAQPATCASGSTSTRCARSTPTTPARGR